MKPSVGAIHELPLPMVLAIQTIAYRTCIQQRPNPNPAKNFTQVNNDDEGGDYAQINLTLRNFIVELE